MVNWQEIDRLAKAHHLTDPTINEKALLRFLRLWWCITYRRPLKDPLLKEYTIDELVYEYLIHFYQNPDNDPKKKKEEEAQEKEDEEWVKKMLAKQAAQTPPQEPPAPPNLPEISTKFD